MFQRILVPLDGSPGAERSIPAAARIARSSGGSITFLHVISPSMAAGSTDAGSRKRVSEIAVDEQALTDAVNYLSVTLAAYPEELAGIPTEMDVACGSVSPILSSTARLKQVDLIVMCSHREAGLGRWGRESVAQQMTRHSPVPLLVLNEHGEIPLVPDATHPLRVLVPLDGSLFAETVLKPTLQLISQLAGSVQSELCLVRIVDLLAGYGRAGREAYMDAAARAHARQEAEEYLKAIGDYLSKESCHTPKLHMTSSVRECNDIARAILSQAAQIRGDDKNGSATLIAIATHGREGMLRFIMGSVAEYILDETTHPVLIVCLPKTETSA